MRIKIRFSLIIFLILGTLNLYAEESAVPTEQPAQENRNGTGRNNFVNGVVTGYKAVEDGVVNVYRNIENWFTKTFNIPVPGQSSQTRNPSIGTVTEGE